MKLRCDIPIDAARDTRDLLENEIRDQRALLTSAVGIESWRDQHSTTTPTVIGTKQWFCLFRGDGGPMAISVESVAEVLQTDTLIRLAWSPPQVVGMCSFHREVVPVVKLGALPREIGEEVHAMEDPTVALDAAGKSVGIDEPTRCVVLVLKSEHGAWGIRVDSESTIMSRESPEFHPPPTYASGPVLIGVVRFAGTCYAIVDAEATWRGLRSAVGRWSGLISESNPSSPQPSGEEPIPANPGAMGELREA